MPFDELKKKLNRAKEQMADLPSREEQLALEEDTTMLPNEAMAGYGMRNVLGALMELAPDPVEVAPEQKIPGTNIMAPAVQMDPLAIGSIRNVGTRFKNLAGAANRADKAAELAKFRGEASKVNDLALGEKSVAKNLKEYKEKSPLQKDLTVVKEPVAVEQNLPYFESGEDYKKMIDAKLAAKRAKKQQ